MSLQQTIKDDMKTAMKARDSVKVTTLRGVMSAFTNKLVTLGKMPQDPLGDEDALAVIKTESKRRKDAIKQYSDAGRPELAAGEQSELEILEAYLPEMMPQEEIEKVVAAKIADLGIESGDKSQTGKLIGAVMGELKGKADGADVKEVVERLLS